MENRNNPNIKKNDINNTTSKGRQEDDMIYNEIDKNLKLVDSGHTFLSFISKKSVIIIGSIKDYLNKSNWQLDHQSIVNIEETNYEPFKCTITKIEFQNQFVPIHVSCNKFSIAILLKYIDAKSKLLETVDRTFENVIQEISGVLKSKNLTFQTYFLNDFDNENLYHDNSSKNFSLNSISENEFEDKLETLINTDRNKSRYEEFYEKMVKLKIKEGSRINMLKLFEIMEGKPIHETKLVILGDFQKNWLDELKRNLSKNDWNKKKLDFNNMTLDSSKEHFIIQNWVKIFKEQAMFFELPKLILPIKQIEMGENHVLILTRDGSVYGFGDGSQGATGTGVRAFHCTPIKVNFLKSDTIISIIVSGAKHSFAMCEKNFVYAWGCGMHGRLGLGNDRDVFKPRTLDFFSNLLVKQIDAGDTYSACVSLDGNLYTWGHGEYGRLGLDEITNVSTPTKVEILPSTVVSVKCGYYCTTIKTIDNCVYTLGCKSISYTQNKHQKNLSNNTPIINEIEGIFFREIDLKYCRGEYPLYAISGYQYIAIFTNGPDNHENQPLESRIYDEVNSSYRKCNLYIFGNLNINILDSSYFKPLLFRSESLILPQDLNSLIRVNTIKPKDNIKEFKGLKKIICSNNNTAVLSGEGDLFTFGSSQYSIASDLPENYTLPVQPKGIKILSCALGLNHIIMLSFSNQIFSAGRNKEGQLGLEYISDHVGISSAQQIVKLKEYNIKKCYACENYSAVLTYEGSVFLFGDISHSEFFKFQKLQSEPKQMSWGEVCDIALGPDHILMVTKHSNSRSVEIKAIGNGTYGKLGNNSKEHNNEYSPVQVDIKIPANITFKDIRLGCSRYTSACLIKDKENKNELYVWGVCFKFLFNNDQKDLNKNISKYPIQLPFENSLVISKPTKEDYFKDNIKSFAITENLIYIINDKKEMKFCGSFFTMRDRRKNKSINAKIKNSQGFFKKVSVAVDHAAAISSNDKLYTWGYNICNKLGFKTILQPIEVMSEDKFNEANDFEDKDKYLLSFPSILADFNKIFEFNEKNNNIITSTPNEEIINKKANEQLPVEESKSSNNNITIKTKETVTSDINKNINNNNTTLEKEKPKIVNKDKDKFKHNNNDNIFSSTQALIENFENLEGILMEDEIFFKNKIKENLKAFEFLVDYEKNSTHIKKSLYSQFNFKIADPPLNIKLKVNSSSNLPFQYLNYKQNFKALLTTLHLHPCYIIKIYENNYISDKELYKIIKQLYFNISDNAYSQLLLITIIKMVIVCDVKKIQNKLECSSGKTKNFLDNLQIIKFSNEALEMNLFARLCKFYIKQQLKFTKKLEFVAIFLIGIVYNKTAGKGASVNWEKSLLIRYHPSISQKKRDMNDLYSYYRNSRVDLIFEIFKVFCDLLNTNEADIDNYKNNPVFTGFNFEKKNKSEFNNLFMKLDKSILLLISEIYKTMSEFLNKITDFNNSDNVAEWIAKSFPFLLFHRLIQILENPMKNISIDVSILIDKFSFKSFMDKSLSNFYSLSFFLKNFCVMMSNLSEIGNDEILKLIVLKFKEYNSSFYSALKNIMIKDIVNPPKNKEANKDFDLLVLSEFFKHSLNDRHHVINFSLHKLKMLQNVIVENIENIRILNKGFDLMDMIFFNKKSEFYIGEDKGLKTLNIDPEEDRIIQVKLKTRSLALQKLDSLMKCQHCNIILLHDFILSNESPFYREFPFLNRASKEGSFLKILKTCDPIQMKNEDICSFFEEQIGKSDKIEFKDSLYFLFTLLADDQKKFYICEEDIQVKDALIGKMFKMHKGTLNLIFKEYCKFIKANFDLMKSHQEYCERLKKTLKEIKSLAPDDVNSDISAIINPNVVFRKHLFEKINKNFEKGFGNPDLLKYSNSFNSKAKLLQLNSHIKNMPKSNNLYLKLSQENKKNLIPIREFPLKKLIDNRVIYKVLSNSDANKK